MWSMFPMVNEKVNIGTQMYKRKPKIEIIPIQDSKKTKCKFNMVNVVNVINVDNVVNLGNVVNVDNVSNDSALYGCFEPVVIKVDISMTTCCSSSCS
jgi:hypothetical protein